MKQVFFGYSIFLSCFSLGAMDNFQRGPKRTAEAVGLVDSSPRRKQQKIAIPLELLEDKERSADLNKFINSVNRDKLDVEGKVELEADEDDIEMGDAPNLQCSLLAYAARLNNSNAVYFLLNAGANPNAIDSRGNDVLAHALSTRKHPADTWLLIARGACVTRPNEDGETPLEIVSDIIADVTRCDEERAVWEKVRASIVAGINLDEHTEEG